MMLTVSRMEIVLKDPLSEVARRERRLLLGISMLSIFIAHAGLLPKKVSLLGIEFEPAEQNAFLIVMALMVFYFVSAFFIYGLMDFLAWRVSYNRSAKSQGTTSPEEIARLMSDNEEGQSQRHWIAALPSLIAIPLSFIRVLFEFLLPILVGIYAFFALIFAIK